MNAARLTIAIVSVIAIAIGASLSYRLVSPSAAPGTATVLPQSIELPPFALVDHHGRTFTRDSLRGRWSVVFFGFTHCPDVCPLTLKVLADARRRLADAGQLPLPQIVLVSVDPERDTPAVMADYVRYFNADVIGVSGDIDEVRKLADGLGIFFQRAGDGDSDYLVDHSAAVLVVDPAARFSALFGAPHAVENYVNDLPLILAER